MPAEGIGTISFSLKDDAGVTHNIDLHNVIFFPKAAQNLISVSQWSIVRKDNCSLTSRAQYSTFTWNNDRYTKSVPHSPSVAIPLMKVNEDHTEFALFVTRNRHLFLDNNAFLDTQENVLSTHNSTEVIVFEPNLTSGKQPISNQQDTIPPPPVEQNPGDIVRCMLNNKRRICVIVN